MVLRSDALIIHADAGGANWMPPVDDNCDSAVVQYNFPENYPGMFQNYLLGVNGTCTAYELDPTSYWCQPNGRTGL